MSVLLGESPDSRYKSCSCFHDARVADSFSVGDPLDVWNSRISFLVNKWSPTVTAFKNIFLVCVLCNLCSLGLVGCSSQVAVEEAAAPGATPILQSGGPDAAVQFEKIKSLVGQWYLVGGKQLGRELEPKPDEPFVTYAESAGGHCVIEKLFVGQPKEMTTVYHLDGDRLVLAHYCSLGNQPHMVAIPSGENEISFELVKVGNMINQNDLHISSHSLEFVSNDELTAHWSATKDQKPASNSLFKVKRK